MEEPPCPAARQSPVKQAALRESQWTPKARPRATRWPASAPYPLPEEDSPGAPRPRRFLPRHRRTTFPRIRERERWERRLDRLLRLALLRRVRAPPDRHRTPAE